MSNVLFQIIRTLLDTYISFANNISNIFYKMFYKIK